MARYSSIVETIGNTPLVKLAKLAPAGVNLYVKIEAFNPMGSVKDRMARAIIERAEQTGQLRPGQTVVEATSGNTGIGLAMVCARKGYPLVVTMAESFSVERRKLLRFLGAKVVLTPAAEKGTGMLAKAVELAETHGWFLCRQFENEANADAHSLTTAREILADFRDEPLHYWVSGFGTGGTLKGVSRALRKSSPATKIIAQVRQVAPEWQSVLKDPDVQAFIIFLARLDTLDIQADSADRPKEYLFTVFDGGEIFVPAAGLVDKAKERSRLEKNVAQIDQMLARGEAQLANPDFVRRAPAEEVDRLRTQIAQMKLKLARLRKNLEGLG